MIVQDFIEKFHNLEGWLLKEKKKSLFILLESHKSFLTEEHILQEINEKLVPKTYLEEIYKLEFLLYFRRASDLFEILQNGNDIAASKIIKQPWFIKSLFKNFDSKEFVQKVFPTLSVAVRAKILKQILKEFKNEDLINALFDDLLESYGMRPAIILLSGCSVDKIKEFLLNGCQGLSKAQLTLLHDKDPSLINIYYEEFNKIEGDVYVLSDFSKYLCNKNPKLLVELALEYDMHPQRLGRRTTKDYVSKNKEAILQDPKKFLHLGIFHAKALGKQLGADFSIFLKAAFPVYISDLMRSDAFELLNTYQKSKRYNLYQTVFEDVYKKSLFPNKQYITHDLLEGIQNDQEREMWVEVFDNNIEYIKYKRSTLAIVELIKELEGCDDVKLQKKLSEYIVTSCSISKDYDALLDILKLFCKKFRNRHSSVLKTFLEKIYQQIKLNELTDDHWKYIHEIISMENIQVNAPIVFEYLKFLYRRGRDIEEMIPVYLKADYYFLTKMKFRDETLKDDKFQREFLRLILEYYTSEVEGYFNSKDIVSVIKNWNKRHPDDIILASGNKVIINSLKECFVVHGDDLSQVKYLVCRENCWEEYTDIYFNEMNCLSMWKRVNSRGCTDRRGKRGKRGHKDCSENVTMTKWYLKYKPNVFRDKVDKVIECLHINTRYSLMRYLKKYEHTGLTQTITKYYLEKLEGPEERLKNKIAQLLALIMSKNDYLKLLEKYAPEIDKLNSKKTVLEKNNLQKIQIALSKSIRFANCQVEALPIILKYCTGHFFRPALYSLYCCFHRTPEKSLKNLLDFLSQKSVSVRKHAIFLAALVFPMKINKELRLKIIDREKNYSIQKHLFTRTYKNFLKNPVDESWNAFQTHITQLTVHEEESLILLTEIHVFPEKYKCLFVEQVCKIFNDLEDKEKTSMNVYYDKLMGNLGDNDMMLLSRDLCIDIISKKLFEEQNKTNNVCVDFTIKFLMYGSNMRDNIQCILKIMKQNQQKHCNARYGKCMGSVNYGICRKIFDKTISECHRNTLPREFSLLFREEWKKFFSIHETFEEYLLLDLLVLKHQGNDDLTFYAAEISKMFKYSRNLFGDSITGLFYDFLSQSLELLLGYQNYKLKVIKLLAEMLETDTSPQNCLLVVELLPSTYVYIQHDDEFIKNYNHVLEKLRTGGEIVQSYLNTHLTTRHFIE